MLDNVNAITIAIRHMLSMFDTAVYFALEYVYQLFFNVASTNVISGKIIFDLFSRVQLIIGIFMVFLLTINIIKGIINPDTFTDSKSGFGNMITRIVVSLVLLALLVPLNIRSPRNDYEKRINNSGILFGTLYSLQDRILKQDTIGKLIFGNNNNNYTSDDENAQENIYTFSRRFSSAVLKSFYVLNVDDKGKSICEDGEGYDNIYAEDALSPVTITSMATLTCTVSEENENHTYGLIDLLSPTIAQISHQVADALDQSFVISIIPLLPTIAGIALAILMFMITFDVAVRVFKLAALQLLAPIPIISYMDPKGGKDTAFNTWVKLLTSTYLDLFIHLGVIYFAISIVSALMKQLPAILISNASNTGSAAATIALLRPTFVILCIGLFIFAKEAPKFLKEMLGIKSDKKFFGAFGEAIGLGTTAIGAIGSINSSRQASKDADIAHAKERGMKDPEAYANRTGNKAKHALAGLFGGAMGIATGSAAASRDKGNALAKMMSSMNAMNERNVKVRAAGRDGGSLFGAIGSLGQEAIYGQNEYDRLEAGWKAREQAIKDKELINKRDIDINAHRKAIMDRVNSKAVDNDKYIGTYELSDSLKKIYSFDKISGNYRNWHSVSQAALTNGVGVYQIEVDGKNVDVFDYDGKQIRVADIGDLDYGMLDAAKEAYYQAAITNPSVDSEVWEHKKAYEDGLEVKFGKDDERTKKGIEKVFGTGDGLKSKFGEESRRIGSVSDELNKERETINRERQGYQGQRAAANSKRFRK